MIAATVTHSTGINWGQALATGVSIVLGILGILAYFNTSINKRREKTETRFAEMIERSIDKFGTTVGGRLDKVETHLGDQDGRLARIERKQDEKGQ